MKERLVKCLVAFVCIPVMFGCCLCLMALAIIMPVAVLFDTSLVTWKGEDNGESNRND